MAAALFVMSGGRIGRRVTVAAVQCTLAVLPNWLTELLLLLMLVPSPGRVHRASSNVGVAIGGLKLKLVAGRASNDVPPQGLA